ncbi:catalase HPII [bacterium SCGC AG-212-C10]|nr:catalase HPII [bacterium SCGC AG-212-C10]
MPTKNGKPGSNGSGGTAPVNAKDAALEAFREHPEGTGLTTDHGLLVNHTNDSLKAGVRGPSLIEDFHLREKITRFDHERIPERVVHARGSAAHGFFQVYRPLGEYTKAKFLNNPDAITPVFVRFSTVAGSRGSADTARDVRGFATKFYTEEGNFDLVGNNIPVFFIQDGIKFPDLVHAVKPEPHNEIPQAASAHDSFWDFVSLQPETAHMIMWVMSDRAIPRSYRMMEGFGVHTFRLINDAGESKLVKFHWKPVLGTHSLVWDEAQVIAGRDPDFHRRDLWDAIEAGAYPEWELGLQVFSEEDELKFGWDMLDATKLLPEELVPVEIVGKLTLNRNPDNFFAETEQVAFHVGNLVPGIDVTNDPLIQARLFSYLDTQLTRLGGPNFAEIPINRPIAAVHNHQQDGFHRDTINAGRANYFPNSIGGGFPAVTPEEQGGYKNFEQPVEGTKIRVRSETFKDFFSQATLFYNSLTPPEQDHLTQALQFELSKVTRPEVRQRVVTEILAPIDSVLTAKVAAAIGAEAPDPATLTPASQSLATVDLKSAPSLSMLTTVKGDIRTRMVALLLAPGFDAKSLAPLQKALADAGATPVAVAPTIGAIVGKGGAADAKMSFLTAASVQFDGLVVAGGRESVDTLLAMPRASDFVGEAYRHFKTIAAVGEGADLLAKAGIPGNPDPGVIVAEGADLATQFAAALGEHRHWSRPIPPPVPDSRSAR